MRDCRGGPQPGWGVSDPHGSISASGQLPGLANFAHFARVSKAERMPVGNCCAWKSHPSQMSSAMRHICEYSATSAAWLRLVGPGERLSTIGRRAFLMAVAIMRILADFHGWSAIVLTLHPRP